MACDTSFIVKREIVLKVTSSHVHFKSGIIISETVPVRDVATTGH